MTPSQGSACHKPLLSRAAFLGTAVSKPHACCCLPHELSVISTPPCLPRPRIKARTCGGLSALLFSRQPSRAPRKLEQEQVRPGFDYGIYGGRESRQRGRVSSPVGARARLWAVTEPLAIRGQGMHSRALEHAQYGPFVGCPGGVLSAAGEYYTPTPELPKREEGMGVGVRKEKPCG